MRMVTLAAVAALALASAGRLGAAPAAEPAGGQQEVRVAVTPDAGEVTAWLQAGTAQPGIVATLSWEDGSKTTLRIQAAGATAPAARGQAPAPLPDATLDFPELRIRRWVRPNPACYPPKLREALVGKWETLPPASTYRFPLSLRLDTAGLEYWIDGRYAGRVDKGARLKEAAFRPSAGAAVSDARCAGRDDARFLKLDIGRMARPGAMQDAQVSLKPGAGLFGGVPIIAGSGKDNADVGMAKELTGGGLEVDPYLARTSFDGMPESLLYSVPLDQYDRAWVLCAAEEDPAKDPVLTARLTRFASDGHGGAIADTTVWLPRGAEKPAAGLTKVGTVSYGGKSVPLWLAEIPLKSGEIQDLIFIHKNEACNDGLLPDRHYLDFELLGKLDVAYPQNDRSHKPDPASTSGVHVFGVTLERSPATMEVRQAQVGNVFQGAEKPEVGVALQARVKGTYFLRWAMRDVEGKPAGKGEKRLSLDPAAGEQVVPVPLAMQEKGWYGLTVALDDARGRRLVEHPAAFALLPPDTRKAGYESPYETWWFGSAHRGSDSPEIGGPLMLKAGLRKTTFGWHKCTEADMAPWKVTTRCVPWMGDRFFRKGADPQVGAQEFEKAVREYLQKFPHCSSALIFHESYSNDIAPELRGAQPPALTQEQEASWQARRDRALNTAKVLREKFPNLKIIFGNTSCSSALAAEFFRGKFPKELIDMLGVEAAGQQFEPEKLTEWGTQAAWLLRETGRKMGYDLPITCCYEWLYRQERMLGPQRLAEWYVRDALIAHAYRFPNISLAILYDVGNCYYNSLWGGSGLCQRYPLLYPKPAYVAYATLTRVLDGAKLIRQVPTGSRTLYALEFARAGGPATVLWTPRGTCAASLRFPRDVTVKVEDLYGRSRTLATTNGRLTIEAGTAAQYVESPVPVAEIAAGKRAFDPPPANVSVVNAMDNADEWQVTGGKDARLESRDRAYLPLRTAGKFVLRAADDPDKGRCLEVELVPEGALPDIVSEYTLLSLKKPALVPGRPTTLGVWVKGNSGWGRVMWSFEDAEGKRWLSCGTDGWGCDILDWPGDISVNFDGWCFLRFPITDASPVKEITPGGVDGQWVVEGGKDKKVAYPIKLTGLAVEMTRKSLELTEMTPVKPVLRFKDLSAY